MKTSPDTEHQRSERTRQGRHVCPWWLGYVLLSPLRKLVENPERLLLPLLRPGMRVLDFGAAMGFYSIPAARLVGEAGRVTCIDLQPKMLSALRRRAERAGLGARIETVLAAADGLGDIDRARSYDLALVIHALHEVPDPAAILRQIAGVLAPGGLLLLIEPRGHVTAADFAAEIAMGGEAGLREQAEVRLRRGFGVLLVKPAECQG